MIWFGYKPLPWVEYSYLKFKQVNPEFNVILITANISDLTNIYHGYYRNQYDICIKTAIDCLTRKSPKYNDYISNQKHRFAKTKNSGIPFLADIARLEILNQFGGIYVDCDTLPLKPFDNSLLENDFIVEDYTSNGNITVDNYFFGISKKSLDSYIKSIHMNNCEIQNHIFQPQPNQITNIKFIRDKYNFFNNSLKSISNYNTDNYIIHYKYNSWLTKTQTIPPSFLDSYV